MSFIDARDILNRASALIGSDPIDDVQDDTPGGQSYEMLYDARIRFMLGLHTWSFARKTVHLTRLQEDAFTGFNYVFILPPDTLGSPLRITDDPSRPEYDFWDYTLEESRVHSNPADLYASIKFMAPPARWSGTFTGAAITALAGDLAQAQTSDEAQMLSLHRLAFGTPSENYRGGMVRAAINEDDFAKPPRRMPIGRDPLSAARFG